MNALIFLAASRHASWVSTLRLTKHSPSPKRQPDSTETTCYFLILIPCNPLTLAHTVSPTFGGFFLPFSL